MRLRKTTVSILLLAVVVILAFIVITRYRNIEQIEILEVKVLHFTKNSFRFALENPYHEKLQYLRRREKLDALVKTARNEFEKILLIKDWTRKQWEPCSSFPDVYPPWDASVILDWIREGKTGGFCGQYGVVFAQALMSIGIPVRYIDIADKEENGHFLTEVWSRDFNKWVVMDPYFDLHYEKDDSPLSALELHEAAVSQNFDNIRLLKGPYVKYENYNIKNLGKLFYRFKIVQRTDHFSYPVSIALIKNVLKKTITVTLRDSILQWKDTYTAEYLDETLPASSDIKDFYYEPHMVYIEIKDINNSKGELSLKFSNSLFSGKKFSLKIDTSRKWITVPDTFLWKLHKGYNRLYIMPEGMSFSDKGYAQSYMAVKY